MGTGRQIFCAIDTPSLEDALGLCARLEGLVGGVKLGLEFFSAQGPAGVRRVAEAGLPVFLDLKLHDIPSTVAGAVRALTPLAPAMLTLHAAGGAAMMKAAAEAASQAAADAGVARPKLLGVTVLTSLAGDELSGLGIGGTAAKQVERLAQLALRSGLDGVVCSPREAENLRAVLGRKALLVVPGIRPEGAAAGDQKRVMTPREAIAAGADYLVIGRPVTGADDPAAAARAIAESLA